LLAQLPHKIGQEKPYEDIKNMAIIHMEDLAKSGYNPDMK
jgi:hypothetical protein